MKSHRFNLHKLTYIIDFPVLLLFFAVFVDTLSTLLFVMLKSGTETNPILGELISISIWFIPIYLFLTNAIFVPFLHTILRKTFSYTIGLISILLGLNNLSLVVFDYAFLVDVIGFNSIIILVGLFGLTIFVYFVKKEKLNTKETINMSLNLLLFLLILGLIQCFFVLIGWLAFL
jgi:hypothetical protein